MSRRRSASRRRSYGPRQRELRRRVEPAAQDETEGGSAAGSGEPHAQLSDGWSDGPPIWSPPVWSVLR